jgi:hypothetical protein
MRIGIIAVTAGNAAFLLGLAVAAHPAAARDLATAAALVQVH